MTAPRSVERQLLLRSLGFAVALAMTYLVMIRLGLGQRLDDLAFEGRKAARLEVRRAATAVMRRTTPLLALGVAVTVMVASVRRRRARDAALVVGSTVVTVLLARWLKEALPRTNLLDFSYATTANTFPSGHAATIMVAALGVLTVAPQRWRWHATTCAITIVVIDLTALQGSGWHRPSDVLGGLFLAAAVLCLGTALLGPAELIDATPPLATGARPRMLAVLAMVLVGSLLTLVLFRYPVSNPAHPLPRFAVALVVTNLCAVAILWTHVQLLDRLGPPVGRIDSA